MNESYIPVNAYSILGSSPFYRQNIIEYKHGQTIFYKKSYCTKIKETYIVILQHKNRRLNILILDDKQFSYLSYQKGCEENECCNLNWGWKQNSECKEDIDTSQAHSKLRFNHSNAIQGLRAHPGQILKNKRV